MRKVDFTAQPEQEGGVFTDVAVGQALQLAQQEDGSWACTRADGSSLCSVPPDAVASLRAAQQQQQQQQHGGSSSSTPSAVIRSVKRSAEDPSAAVSIQVRISFAPPGQPPPLTQAPAPVDDPAGFSLTTQELEQLAYNKEVRSTLQDRRLQAVLRSVDGATNREQALQQALDNPDFREFADKMLHVMKPEQYPAVNLP